MKKSSKINKRKILLIIPSYNEEASIVSTIEMVKKIGYDYIIINDGSTDQTKEICRIKKYKHIDFPINVGVGGAMKKGYEYALENDYDIAIQFDADGQHDIKYVNILIETILRNDADLVIGSRFINKSYSQFKSTIMRRIGISMISTLIKFFSGKKIYDTTSGFRAVNKRVIKKFSETYPKNCSEPISTFKLLKLDYKVKEVPVSMNKRIAGTSSLVFYKKVYYMIYVFTSIIAINFKKNF